MSQRGRKACLAKSAAVDRTSLSILNNEVWGVAGVTARHASENGAEGPLVITFDRAGDAARFLCSSRILQPSSALSALFLSFSLIGTVGERLLT